MKQVVEIWAELTGYKWQFIESEIHCEPSSGRNSINQVQLILIFHNLCNASRIVKPEIRGTNPHTIFS